MTYFFYLAKGNTVNHRYLYNIFCVDKANYYYVLYVKPYCKTLNF